MSNDLQEVQTPDPREIGTLARKMGEAYGEMMHHYVRNEERTYSEARDRLQEVPEGETLARLQSEPAAALSWWELNELASVNPETMMARWEEVKQAARDELQSGHRAASAVLMPVHDSPMERAQFLVIREDLCHQWNPVGGIENTLIDQMAQAWTMQLFWQELAATRSLMEHTNLTHDKPRWDLPRVDQVEATEQATMMVDRWNRMFLRQLRALRDMRRYSPQVTIHSTINQPAQVNIGEKQVNVAHVNVAAAQIPTR